MFFGAAAADASRIGETRRSQGGLLSDLPEKAQSKAGC